MAADAPDAGSRAKNAPINGIDLDIVDIGISMSARNPIHRPELGARVGARMAPLAEAAPRDICVKRGV
jgi:hypothetical protein